MNTNRYFFFSFLVGFLSSHGTLVWQSPQPSTVAFTS